MNRYGKQSIWEKNNVAAGSREFLWEAEVLCRKQRVSVGSKMSCRKQSISLEAEGPSGKQNTPVGSAEDLYAWIQSVMWKTECLLGKLRVPLGSNRVFLREAEGLCGSKVSVGNRKPLWEADHLCGKQHVTWRTECLFGKQSFSPGSIKVSLREAENLCRNQCAEGLSGKQRISVSRGYFIFTRGKVSTDMGNT
jgi:hypothetical protein